MTFISLLRSCQQPRLPTSPGSFGSLLLIDSSSLTPTNDIQYPRTKSFEREWANKGESVRECVCVCVTDIAREWQRVTSRLVSLCLVNLSVYSVGVLYCWPVSHFLSISIVCVCMYVYAYIHIYIYTFWGEFSSHSHS